LLIAACFLWALIFFGDTTSLIRYPETLRAAMHFAGLFVSASSRPPGSRYRESVSALIRLDDASDRADTFRVIRTGTGDAGASWRASIDYFDFTFSSVPRMQYASPTSPPGISP
jgi:hypothetical protein